MTEDRAQLPDARRVSSKEVARIGLVFGAVVMGVVALALLLWKASNVVLLVVGAVLFAIFLRSISHWIAEHTSMGATASLVLTLATLIALTTVGGYFLAPRIADQFDELSQTIPRSVDQVTSRLEQYQWGQWILERLPGAGEIMSPSAAARRAGRFFSTVFGAVTAFFVVLIAGVFIAFSPGVYRRGVLLLVPPKGRPRADELLVALESTMSWWLLGRILSMTVIGVLTWVGLMLLGIPLALTLGVIAGALSFIPYVGPILSAVPAVLLALTIDPSRAWHVVLLYVGIQLVESNLITPIIEKKTVWLPPALTIVMQVLAGLLFGPLGVVLATPLTAAVLVIVKMLYLEDLLGENMEVSRAT